jgi:hypothetical protein
MGTAAINYFGQQSYMNQLDTMNPWGQQSTTMAQPSTFGQPVNGMYPWLKQPTGMKSIPRRNANGNLIFE